MKEKLLRMISVFCSWVIKRALPLSTLGIFLFSLGGWFWFAVYQPSPYFPLKTIITIPEGASLATVARVLEEKEVIQNEFIFGLYVKYIKGEKSLVAGDYYFDENLTLRDVVHRVLHGTFGLEPVRVTIPEGATTYQMAEILGKKFERFDKGTFLLLARDKEGYLFPDTYLFLPNVTTEEILSTMERTFYEKLRILEEKIAFFGKPVHEIVTMASLLEKEAWNYDDRRIIAGVLWNRLDIDMPLQVDAVFGFIGKTDTFSPKFSDLKTDSLYNTYKYEGLPPGPIGSPSLEALEAAVSPEETEALFYLHGRDGFIHIAHTYSEHLKNRRSYLD